MAEQWLKLQYYGLYVPPFRLRAQETAKQPVVKVWLHSKVCSSLVRISANAMRRTR